MNLKIKKEVTEEITVDLSVPKYFCFLNTIYVEFTEPEEGKVLVRRFYSHPDGNNFDLSVRPALDNDYEILKGEKGWNETNEATFYTILAMMLNTYGIAKLDTIES